MFFLKNNQRTALTKSPMMADSPLFSATITTGHPHWTYIGALSEYFPYSDTTNTTCILIIVITNQHHVLGVIISQNSVKMDPVKVAGVMEWPILSNRKEVQSFLGFTNFYRRFIQGFSHLAHPLLDLTWKDTEWRWGAEEQSAFDSLKEQITTAPILALLDNSRPFRIEADSSDFATGAILSQQSPEDNKWNPVAFLSKSLSPVERNYEIHDKEMLAIVRALEEWRHFVEGAEHRCEIWTDHKNLQYFMTAKKLNWRQARWSLLLARFDFIMHHRPSKSMGKTDALSRWSDHGTGSEDNDNMVLLTPNFFAV